MARRPPASLDDMGRLREINQDTLNRYGEKLLALFKANQDLSNEPLVEDKRLLQPEQEPVVDLLMACLRQAAQQNDLAPAALGKRADLEKLVAGDRDIALLKGWRKAAAGDRLLDVLEGRLQARLESGKLVFT